MWENISAFRNALADSEMRKGRICQNLTGWTWYHDSFSFLIYIPWTKSWIEDQSKVLLMFPSPLLAVEGKACIHFFVVFISRCKQDTNIMNTENNDAGSCFILACAYNTFFSIKYHFNEMMEMIHIRAFKIWICENSGLTSRQSNCLARLGGHCTSTQPLLSLPNQIYTSHQIYSAALLATL